MSAGNPGQRVYVYAVFSSPNRVHANGGIVNGGVACVGAEWRVFAHFCAFLCFFVRFCAFFSCQNGLQKSANLRRILQKCAKSAFMQYPL